MSYRYFHSQRRSSNNNCYYGMAYPQPEQPMHYNGYFIYQHPLEMEYQRSRPAKLSPRVLNRRFKKVTIQLNENRVLVVSVAVGKGNKPSLVFSQCEGSYENRTSSVSIPEALVVPFIQQLHKLSKWRPSTSGSLPASQGLSHEDTVFRALVACQSGPEVPPESRLYAIRIVAEARARDPHDRKELAAVSIPLETSYLMKVKEALNDVIVASAESPLYHTKSLHCADGSKFYLDMIRDDEAHYLKVSQVTREYRSIMHVPAEDLDAFKDIIEASVQAMKSHLDEHKAGSANSSGSSKKRRNRQSRRRQKRSTDGKGGQEAGNNKASGGSESTASDCEETGKENAKPKPERSDNDTTVGKEDAVVEESKKDQEEPKKADDKEASGDSTAAPPASAASE
ncbi:hypothetical protein BOX15_Mlig029117g1 [Macrostomum lignano]|uniref:Uncharacterized protein n=1 Tax=Macrostomum lignano TaxID=282301 RepID=A0A267G043_9PLAT|nr:hypothetical protein BOX15_Mlig029117g1 [Macrostomum lignano]